jgi:transmembrane sensor
MNRKPTLDKVNPQARERAAEWLVAFCEQEVDASGRESFDRWLRASPEHVRAYLQICALGETAGLLESTNIDTEALVRRALSEHNVWSLSGEQRRSVSSGTRFPQSLVPPVRRAIAACFLFACAIGAGVIWWQLTRTPMYETGPAEQRTVRLPDGSTVQLNARSRIELHFTTQQRAVDLLEGQAMFSAARNPNRPFIVRSDVADVRAVGTRFDVYRKSSGTVVTVMEGTVAIGADSLSSAKEPASALLLSAGEQAVATSQRSIHAYRTNVFAATAWTEGKLTFDSAPLRDVVAEFNRVGSRRLTIEDASLLDLHVSGVFTAADSAQLVSFLRERFGVSLN